MDGRKVIEKEIWLALDIKEAKEISNFLQEAFNLTEIGGKMRIEAVRLNELLNQKIMED